jgi:hypothetical protein
LAIVKYKMLVVVRDYFSIDVRYACFAVCHILSMTL